MGKVQCACGRIMSKYYYGKTIKRKQCPSCELKNLASGDTKAVTDGLNTKANSKPILKVKSPHTRFYTSTAWRWFSRYILLYYSIDGAVVQCSTCGTRKRVNDKEMHTGHWIKVFDGNSTNYATAFEFTNLGPQCSKCNRFHGGRERLMQNWLTERHGSGELERLQKQSKHPFRLDDYIMDEIAFAYKTKFNILLQQKKYMNPWKK